MRAVLGCMFVVMGCAGGAREDGTSTGAMTSQTGAAQTGGATGEDGGGSGSTGTTTGASSGDPWGSSGDAGGSSGGPVDNGPCDYQLVLEMPGPVLTPMPGASVWEATPLQPGEGFYCVKLEFSLQTADDLAQIDADDPEGCPEYLALASVFGTQATGDVLATAFFRGMDADGGACVPGPARLEVGNYLDYIEGTEGPWSPGQVWTVTLEAKPWLTRITIEADGQPLGPVIAADLYPANVADTRDPVIRLGLPMPVEGRYYPWYAATYADVKIWADVAPAE